MPIEHTVKQGECISSIAEKYEIPTKTIWDCADNANLKNLRIDPNILMAGDIVVVPDKRVKDETIETNQHSKFKKAGVVALFSLKLLDGNKPRANLSYNLMIDGNEYKGKTNGDGILKQNISPSTLEGQLIIDETGENYKILFGSLDPLTEESGVRQRLENFYYLRAWADQSEFEKAIIQFKVEHLGLQQPKDDEEFKRNIQIDDKFRNKLKEIYGS